MSEYELYHHGIKGQKWGVRRTAAQLGHRVAKAGKAAGKVALKAGKAVSKEASKATKAASKAASTKAKQAYGEHKEKAYYKNLHKKKLSQMTDKEIKDLTERVKKEASLKNEKYESRIQNARKFYNTVAKQPVNTFLATYSGKAVEAAFKDSNGKNKNKNKGNDDNKKSDSDDDGVGQKIKDKVSEKYHSYDVNPGEANRKKRRSSNSFNNPVTIRHGR